MCIIFMDRLIIGTTITDPTFHTDPTSHCIIPIISMTGITITHLVIPDLGSHSRGEVHIFITTGFITILSTTIMAIAHLPLIFTDFTVVDMDIITVEKKYEIIAATIMLNMAHGV